MSFAIASSRLTPGVQRALADRTALEPSTGPADVSYQLLPGDEPGETSVVVHDEHEAAHVGYAFGTEAIADLIGDDVHQQIAHRSDDHLLVHAGVVAWRGGAIVVPGRSHTGKSSLVAELVRAGAEYLSDEYAAMDRGGLVHPYPRKLWLRNEDGTSRPVGVDDLGGVVADGPRPLTVVVSTRFVPDAAWDPVSLTGSRALLSLIDNSVVARTRSRHTLAIVAGLGDRVTNLVGPRGGAAATARQVLTRCEELAGDPTARDRTG